MDIFVSRDEKCSGPYSPSEIQGRLSDGRLQLSDKAWYEGLTEWTLISKVDAVSHLMAACEPSTVGLKPVDLEILLEPITVGTVSCPWCVEPVVEGAPKCKHCGEVINPHVRTMLEMYRLLRMPGPSINGSLRSAAMHNAINNADPRRNFPHALHLIAAIFSAGIWSPVWLAHFIMRNRDYYY